MEPAGRDPGRAFSLPAVGPVTLCSQKKSSPFRTIFPPAWGMGPGTTPEVERRPGNYLGDYPYSPAPPLNSLNMVSSVEPAREMASRTDGYLPSNSWQHGRLVRHATHDRPGCKAPAWFTQQIYRASHRPSTKGRWPRTKRGLVGIAVGA